MNTQQSLKALKKEFTQWRKTKKSLRSKVPDDLRRKVLALRAYVSDTELNKTLGIKPPMIQTWSERETAVDSQPQATIDFVSLPTEFLHNEDRPVAINPGSAHLSSGKR